MAPPSTKEAWFQLWKTVGLYGHGGLPMGTLFSHSLNTYGRKVALSVCLNPGAVNCEGAAVLLRGCMGWGEGREDKAGARPGNK